MLSFKTTFGHGGPETWTVDKKNVWFFDKRFSAFGAMADLGVHKTDLLIFLLETKVKKVTAVLKTLDKKDAEGNPIMAEHEVVNSQVERLAIIQDRYFKQCRQGAADFGLTVSSRCRLIIPKAPEAPKTNKFKDKFA